MAQMRPAAHKYVQPRVYLLWWNGSDLWRCWGMDYREYLFLRALLYIRYVQVTLG